jgi:nucleoside-diphosphate-sugar epimerase
MTLPILITGGLGFIGSHTSVVLCNDPLISCTGHTIGEINHEYDDGRRYQEVDGQAQGGFGGGDYSRKDFDLRGFPRLW